MGTLTMSTLDGQVALVTGSSRGIGRAIASELARQGAAVAVHGRDAGAVADAVTSISAHGGPVIGTTGDVTSVADLEDVRQQAESRLGPVDILIANAGASLAPPMALEDISEPAWRATVDANLLATFLTLKCFLPGMKQRGRGAIITLASSAGRQANPMAPIPYAAAKAGIIAMTQVVAAQAGPSGIRVNCLAPGTIMTENNQARIPAATQVTLAESHPLRRLGTPGDVAAAAVFLASAGSGWITGQVLDIAGGSVMV